MSPTIRLVLVDTQTLRRIAMGLQATHTIDASQIMTINIITALTYDIEAFLATNIHLFNFFLVLLHTLLFELTISIFLSLTILLRSFASQLAIVRFFRAYFFHAFHIFFFFFEFFH